MRIFVALVTSILLYSPSGFAQEGLSLRTYLPRALPPLPTPELNSGEKTLLFRKVELRMAADEDALKNGKFRISPFDWNERAQQKELTQLEKELHTAMALQNSTLRSYEIGKLIISLQSHEKRLALLRRVEALSASLLQANTAQQKAQAERPEEYIKWLEDKLELEEDIQNSENIVKEIRQNLALAADINPKDFDLNLGDLIKFDEIQKNIASWPLSASSPSLQTKALSLKKADLKSAIESGDLGYGFDLNFVELGTTFKEDGSPDKFEAAFGLSVPLFSGEFKAKEFELQNSKAKALADFELTRLQNEVATDHLRNKILHKIERLQSPSAKMLEQTMQRAQEQAERNQGSSSLSALKAQLAREKLRLRQHDAQVSTWEDYLDLAQLLGRLDSGAQVLLSNR